MNIHQSLVLAMKEAKDSNKLIAEFALQDVLSY